MRKIMISLVMICAALGGAMVGYTAAARTKDLLGKQDLRWFDGTGTNTFTRLSSTGATLTLNKVGMEVDVLQVYGGGAQYTDASLSAALNAVGSNEVTLKLSPGTWTISNNVTIPATVALYLPRGAIVTPVRGKVITVNGTVVSGHYQCFDTSGGGAVAFAAGSSLYSSWFKGLAELINGLSGSNAINVIVDSSETLLSSLTVGSNISLQCLKGVVLTIADTKTLTIKGPFYCGLWQCFSDQNPDNGGVAFGGTIEKVYSEWWGSVGNASTNDTKAIQAAINSISSGVVCFLSHKKYKITGLTVSAPGVAFISSSTSEQVDEGGAQLLASAGNTVIVTVNNYGFYARGLFFKGTSDDTERGDNVRSIGINFDLAAAATADCDAVLEQCSFAYLQDCVKLQGRNLKGLNCTVMASKRGFYIPDSGLSDMRGLELYGCRFHSIGKTNTPNVAAVYIEPGADWQECIISGFLADDCWRFFYGFASGLNITGGAINKARGTGIYLNSEGHTIDLLRRVATIAGVSYYQETTGYADTYASSGLYAHGAFILNVTGLTVTNCGGNGIETHVPYSELQNCVVHNAGQKTTNTYDAFVTVGDGIKIKGCSAHQDQLATASNKARYGFNIEYPQYLDDGCFADSNFAKAAFNGRRENSGMTAAIASGTNVAHGLGATPRVITVTAAESGPTDIYVSNADSSNFKINYGGGGSKTFYWRAVR